MQKPGLNEIATNTLQDEHEPASGRSVWRVRDLAAADLPAVMTLERSSFSNPWSDAMMTLELSQPARVALVADLESGIDGYAIAGRYDQAWHLMKIAVFPGRRRRGVAALLLREVLSRLGSEVPVTLEVRAGNTAAIALYERFGFIVRGRRPGYYADNGEDALLMWRGDPTLAGVPAESFSSTGA